jgi:hypothetical protein
MTKMMNGFLSVLLTLLPAQGEKRVTGKRGRPSEAHLEKFLSNYAQRLPNEARALFEGNPFLGLDTLNALRRELTLEEKAFLAETSDAVFQGTRDGEPVQSESRASFNVMVAEGESLGDAVRETLEVAKAAARVMGRRTGQTHFIHFERWCVTRETRLGRKALGIIPAESLANLPARYQGILYVTNSEAKVGFLSLGEVSPSGKFVKYFNDS